MLCVCMSGPQIWNNLPFFSNSRCSLLCDLCPFNVGASGCIHLICLFHGFISILQPHFPPSQPGLVRAAVIRMCSACETERERFQREEADITFSVPGMCLAQPMMTTSSRSARSHSVVRALMSLSGMVGSGMA